MCRVSLPALPGRGQSGTMFIGSHPKTIDYFPFSIFWFKL